VQLLWHFFLREFRSRYLGSMSGLLWAVVHPALQLLMYALVFEKIFKARIVGAEAHGYVAYLGVGFWAWTLFAEASSRAATSVIDNSALIGKVAISPMLLVLASVLSSAALQLVGYFSALLILALTGSTLDPLGVVLAIPVFALLLVWTLGFALMVAAIQVFVRDLAQVLTQLLAFWFFLTPVLYSRAMLPDFAQRLMDWNPLTYYPERLRELILDSAYAPGWHDFNALLLALCMLGFGTLVFTRLRKHFEDFL
jgi:lipopolysaccharide transport system permease protein